MRRSMELYGAQVEIDMDATSAWYAQSQGWACDCAHCRNFLALARRKMLPRPLLELLDSLGIAPEKATYVCQLSHVQEGHLYQLGYRVAGRILSGERAATHFHWGDGYCWHDAYPYGAPDFPEPHFDLGLDLILPWVLDDAAEP